MGQVPFGFLFWKRKFKPFFLKLPVMNIGADQQNSIRDPNWDLSRLNAVRIIVVLIFAVGVSSTMPLGPGHAEFFNHFGYDPSWFAIQVLFFLSGLLAYRSLATHGSAVQYFRSRFLRNWPLLAAYSLAAASVIYPVFCETDESPAQMAPKLTVYFLKTVSFIDPGARLPGLLDEAQYNCLIQGSIWTLRWGALAHICMVAGWKLGPLRSRYLMLLAAVMLTLAYWALSYFNFLNKADALQPIQSGLRLGYIFVIGACIWAWKGTLPQNGKFQAMTIMALLASIFGAYYGLPWTPAIEILTTLLWSYIALIVIFNNSQLTRWMRNWPNIVFGLYLGIWPISQILVLKFPGLSGWTLVSAAIAITTALAFITKAAIAGYFVNMADRYSSRKIAV